MFEAFGRDEIEAAAFGGRHAYILPCDEVPVRGRPSTFRKS
jgi:hypothetical protein